MSEELDSLLGCAALAALLVHYGRLAEPDREVWHPRLNELDGVGSRELTQHHGDLIAYGWIDLAIHRSTGEAGGKGTGGYRITPEGRRALREAKVDLTLGAEGSMTAVPEATPEVRRPRKKATLSKAAEAADGNGDSKPEIPTAA